ncbi:hypothetical protein HPB50_025592 [Hyalomma asiaticum]|uniref:Uncharacterized protein n=1 Tax=Hyalomma asiaticum TaxID=266040 RepID=A0ACB7TNK2_HYAAI|nr:hypothetical protein HPB50_025592 [Hyalomma asiaticum]
MRVPTLNAIALTATFVGGAVAVAAYFWLRRKARAFVPVGHLASISIHPIKSVPGLDVPYADCTVAGPVYKGTQGQWYVDHCGCIERCQCHCASCERSAFDGERTQNGLDAVDFVTCMLKVFFVCLFLFACLFLLSATFSTPGISLRHMLVVKGDSFVSMREEPRLGMIRVTFNEDTLKLTLTADGYPPLTVDACDPEEHSKPSFTVKVRMFDYKAIEVSQESSKWFRNYLNHDDARLVRVVLDQETISRGKNGAAPVAGQDESSFNVLSKASLDGLLSKVPPDSNIQRRNFRPTLFIDGCEAHSEISDAEMAFLNRTTRCILTTVDQDRGIRTDKEPLVTLRKYRIDRSEEGVKKYKLNPLFGVGTFHVRDGRIKVGDEVHALLSPTPLL